MEARKSEYVDQKSGVSARMTITVMENIVSAAEHRAILNGETSTMVRITDVFHAVPAITGKLELVYEGEQEGAVQVARHLIGKAIAQVFKQYFPDPEKKSSSKAGKSSKAKASAKSSGKTSESRPYDPILAWFSEGNSIELPDTLPSLEYGKRLENIKPLSKFISDLFVGEPAEQHIMMDFLLEGLHQHSMLGKTDLDEVRTFSDMLGSMLTQLNFGEEDDEYDLE
jgi:magnesium chelatase subunit I